MEQYGAESYKAEFVEFLLDVGVLKFGDFIAKSGRRTPYFINAGEIKTGEQIAKLGEFYAKCYLEKIGKRSSVLYGPAYKGIPIAVSTSVALAKRDVNTPFFFNRKEEKDHGEGGIFVGYIPSPEDGIVIVEDIITAGTAIRESLSYMKSLENANISAAIVMVDRKEKGKSNISALSELEEEYGFPIYSIITIYDIIDYIENNSHKLKDNINVQNIRDYLKEWGATNQ